MRFMQWLRARQKPHGTAQIWRASLRPLVASRRRRSLFAVLTATAVGLMAWAAVGLADNPSGCDFAATGTTESCSGPLAGSTFAGGDGNLLTSPTTFGTTDWQNVAGRNTGIDLPSGGTDNSFGQGTKEDSANVTVVTGSIPPQKSDLTRFYEASEFANNSNFLYLAWERTNNLGSANMDFEINQKTQPDLTTTGAKTLNRTAGDLLVTFDFTNGGGKPTLNLLRWLTSATTPSGVPGFPTNVCLSANSFPCWGDEITLNSTNSIGAVNNLDAVTDPFVSNTPNNIGALRFGETAINLTAAGVFPAGTCEAFGSAFLKSRSSASFPAEVKDFVAPVPVNISNCGTVNIIKHTDPRGINQDFSYTSTIPNPTGTPPPPTTPDCTLDTTPSSFTLNDKNGVDPTSPITTGTANTEHCANVPVGSYTVLEGTEPANFTLESLTCTVDGTGGSTGSQDGSNPFQADITLKPNDTVTCTYTNKATGAILVTKTAKNHNFGDGAQHPLAGATFTVNGVDKTTDASGHACYDGLTIGTTYTVTEKSAPAGYSIDTASKDVTVTKVASCTSGTPDSVSFTDSPLTDISANATSEVPGATNSTITCVDANGKTVADSGAFADPANASATGLTPGQYTCTITIDP
jgi:Prealbumin-like fold domain